MRVGVIDSLWGFWEEEEKWVELWDILRTLNEDIVRVDGWKWGFSVIFLFLYKQSILYD